MFAERMHDERDARVLGLSDVDSIDSESLRAYRQRLEVHDPDHPFNRSSDREFLRQVGGWGRDKQTGKEGLTLAGLLMFGKLVSIFESIPHYFLDYRELPVNDSVTDWLDRLTPDGK